MNKLRVMVTDKETALVKSIARKVFVTYCPLGEAGEMTKADFYHYGMIGLLEAKKRYDRSKKVPWLAFAAYRIRGAMLDQLRQQPAIRLPQGVQQKVKELNAAKAELSRIGAPTDANALAGRLDWTVAEVHDTFAKIPYLVPAETEKSGDNMEREMTEVTLTAEGSPERSVMKKEAAELVRRCLEGLPSPKDRLVIEARHLEGLKLRELADVLNCSIENVRQWQKRVEALMRDCMARHGWSVEA